MMTPEVAAQRIQRAITASESTIDTLIGETAGLMADVATARRDSGMPVETGHIALASIAAAQAKILEARREIIRAHKDLRGIAITMDMPECPPAAASDNGELRAA